MEENIRRCAIFGQNAICFKWGFDEDEKQCCRMKRELLQKIMELRQQNVTQFFVACDYGVGLYAAEQINDLRKTDPDLILTVFDSGASAAGPAEEKALAYALVSRKPVLNLDPYTLAVSRIDKRADK